MEKIRFITTFINHQHCWFFFFSFFRDFPKFVSIYNFTEISTFVHKFGRPLLSFQPSRPLEPHAERKERVPVDRERQYSFL